MNTKSLLVKNRKFKSLSEMFQINQDVSVIAGPCSIESLEQLELTAQSLVKNKVSFIRAGAYKPRTSPYDYQGMGEEGLKILDFIRKKYNLLAVSEIMDPRDIEKGVDCADIIQIGSRNMHNYSLLKEAGKTKHPILLKRGFMSTVKEFLFAAEYIVSNGNENVIMCERGVRTFENAARNMLDIACIAILKQETTLPVVVDLSHSLGRKDIIRPVMNAVLAMGIDGIMLEVHDNPPNAKSDSNQQLNIREFEDLIQGITGVL